MAEKNYFLIKSHDERLKLHLKLKNNGYGRLLIETGLGIDLMDADVNIAVKRAIEDIIHRVCIPASNELGISGLRDSIIVIDIGVPIPEELDPETIWDILPVKPEKLYIYVSKGGLETIGYKDCRLIVTVVSIHIYLPRKLC
ncbi:MAG: hypothetical protein GXO43_09715 [Crenarchaeota archaeon]|nr:hypothetical protein [Thermoproteota archaeon]